MYVILLIIGFVLLVKGAALLIDGSSSAAKIMNVPSIVIGMTIVSIGTSLPEASVSIMAAIADRNELSISNVVGSNIFNLMIICGICAILCPMAINDEIIIRDFPISIGAAILLIWCGTIGDVISHIDGIIFLIFFAGFFAIIIYTGNYYKIANDYKCQAMSIWQLLLYIIGGIAAIVVGGKMVVVYTIDIARIFNISENIIGMTIVSFGTSLPELVTSIVAAKKNEVDIAVGNVVGSNIFNILFILGLSSVISPIVFSAENIVDTTMLVFMSSVVFTMCLLKRKLVYWNGVIMIIMYSTYTFYILCIR